MLKTNSFSMLKPLLLCLVLTGCATVKPAPNSPTSLSGLQNMAASKSPNSLTSNEIRMQAIQDTAMSLGAQGGLSYRAQQINTLLANQDKHLSEVFNFTAMLMGHNVLPPVLAEGRNTLNLSDNNSIRLADRTYEIISQARFVTAAPHWRDYLWLNYSAPERPDMSLLPKSRAEKTAWKRYIAEGWQHGIEQANTIYAENLARLQRDFSGMVLYRKLLAQNMVSAPFVASSNLGVTSDEGNNNLRIHDQILRITALPTFRSNSKVWKARISR